MYKILMISPTPFFADRGCHVRIYEEAKELERRGNRVRICTYSLGGDVPGLDIRRIMRVPFYSKLDAGPSYTKLILDALLGERALREARRFKPDIIHAHLHEGCLLGTALRRAFPRPLVFDYQGSLSDESIEHGFVSRNSPAHRAMVAAETWINRSADLIFTSSEHLRSQIKGNGDPSTRVALGDGVDTKLFRPEGDSPGLRERLGVPADRPVVAYLGLLNRYQGVDILLEAAAIMRDRHPRVHFLVMGYPDEGLYMEKARKMGIGGLVTFPGRIDYFKASRYLSLGTIGVAPKISRTESNGKLLNYLACGLPTVCFDTPANREIMGDNAVYAGLSGNEQESAEDLAEKMIGLLEDEGLQRSLAESGRKRATEEFGWERIGRRMMSNYSRLLESLSV